MRNILISIAVAVSSYFSLILVARRFGGGTGSDAYFFLFSLTATSTSFLASIFATVFLPVFVDLKIKSGLDEAARFAGALLLWCLAIIVPVGVFSFVFYTPFFTAVSKFSGAQLREIQPILGYFSVTFVVSVLAEYFRTVVLALGKFSLAAIGALIQPCLLILSIWFLSDTMQEQALAVSLMVAKIALLLFMGGVTLSQRVVIRPRLRGGAATSRFLRIAAPYWSANLVTNFASFYFDYVATGLGAGVLSSVSYAQRVFTLPVFVVLNPIMEIARTKFSESQARGDMDGFSSRYNSLAQLILYFTLPVAAFFAFFAEPIIGSMFQRGAFTHENVQIAAQTLSVLAISIPFSGLFLLNGRATESFQRLTWPSVFGTAGNALLILLTYLLVRDVGYLGIAYARVCVEVLFFLPFGFAAVRVLSGRFHLDHVPSVLLIASIGVAVPLVCYSLVAPGDALSRYFPSMVSLLALTAVFFACYACVVGLLDGRVRKTLRRSFAR